MEYRGKHGNARHYWCETHHQWAYEFAQTEYVFEHEHPLKP